MPCPVIIESPYAGENPVRFRRNVEYLHVAIRDCLRRGEIPFASHGFYPGALDDGEAAQREAGIAAGFSTAEIFAGVGGIRVVYTDRGISSGMDAGIRHASKIGMPTLYRAIGESRWSPEKDPAWCGHPRSYFNPPRHCPDCREEFETVTLPRSAIAVARAWMEKTR